jgi:two-component system, LytTR family, response regulator
MAITAMVVDDEPLARKRMRTLLRAYDDIAVIAEAGGGQEALRSIAERRPRVVFLDVQMPRVNGFDVVRRLGPEACPLIVFVTSYEQYALEAFRASAVQYLLKPVARESLRLAMARVRQLVVAQQDVALAAFLERLRQRPAFLQHIAMTSKGRTRVIRVDEIDWFESAGNYVRLHVGSERFLLRQTMNGLEDKLDPRQFARIHRTTIVNLSRVRDLKPASHGDHVLVLSDETQLLLSRAYRERLEPPR